MSCLASPEPAHETANWAATVGGTTGVRGWFKTCFSKSTVDWKRVGMVALWILALIVPGGLAMLALYATYRAAKSKGMLTVPDVVRQSLLPPAVG